MKKTEQFINALGWVVIDCGIISAAVLVAPTVALMTLKSFGKLIGR